MAKYAKKVYGVEIVEQAIKDAKENAKTNNIENINKIKPNRVIYISCNPATLIRDLAKFEENYEIKSIQPVDMFPFSSHVECVAVLQLK